jgi:hypothetical protein
MVKVKEDMTGWVMSEHGVSESRLTVIKQVDDYVEPITGRRAARWLCECNCKDKNKVIAVGSDIRSGHTKSCGCYNMDCIIERNKKYNHYEKRIDEYGEYYVGFTTNTNKEFYFDIDDYDKIKECCWFESSNQDKTYFFVASHKDGKNVKLHQLIAGKYSDHIDRDPFNNRRRNLRQCTHQENCWNRGAHKDGSSGVAGVCWAKREKKWRAYITIDNKQKSLGYFTDKDEAIKARLAAEKEYFKEFAPQQDLYDEYNIAS